MPSISLYLPLVAAIRDHWKSNDNAYPIKAVMTTDQHRELVEQRRVARCGIGERGAFEERKFLGVPIEIDDTSPGVLIAKDGTVVPLKHTD